RGDLQHIVPDQKMGNGGQDKHPVGKPEGSDKEGEQHHQPGHEPHFPGVWRPLIPRHECCPCDSPLGGTSPVTSTTMKVGFLPGGRQCRQPPGPKKAGPRGAPPWSPPGCAAQSCTTCIALGPRRVIPTMRAGG